MRCYVCQFSGKNIFSPNLPKNGYLGWNLKSLRPNPELAHPRCHVFQSGRSEFFGLNLGKLPNYMQSFGSNNVEGVAESWMETEMSWVEVDGGGWRWVHALAIPFFSCIHNNPINLKNAIY